MTKTYRLSEVASFRKTRDLYGGLSNMATGYPITICDVHFASSEALYQSMKFTGHPNIQAAISAEKNPMKSKFLAQNYVALQRVDWFSVNLPVMKWVCMAKLLQNWSAFSAILLSTGDLPIVEYSTRDPFWGAQPQKDDETILVGQNVLGRILTSLRDHIKKDESRLSILTPPTNVVDFTIVGQPVGPLARIF